MGMNDKRTGMKNRPWTAPIIIVSQIVLKKVRMMYASTVYSTEIPRIVDEAPCNSSILAPYVVLFPLHSLPHHLTQDVVTPD